MKSAILKAHLALLAVNIIYGVNYIVAKDVMPAFLSPPAFVMTRVLGAVALFWLLNRFTGIDRVKTADLGRLALCGLFGVALNQLFFFEGLSLTNGVNAAIIMTSTPVLVILLSFVVLKEKITQTRITGVLLGLGGAIGVIALGGNASSGVNQLGDTFIFINATSYALYLVTVKPLMSKYSPVTVISYVFLFGSAVVVPYSSSAFFDQSWVLPDHVYWKMTFVVLGTTFLAYLLNIFALRVVSPTVSSSYIYLQPVLTFVFALIYDHYFGGNMAGEPGIWHLIFTLLIFSGVYLVSKQSIPTTKKRTKP